MGEKERVEEKSQVVDDTVCRNPHIESGSSDLKRFVQRFSRVQGRPAPKPQILKKEDPVSKFGSSEWFFCFGSSKI